MADQETSLHNTPVNSDEEYEAVELGDNPMYQVLSTLFETEDGFNVAELLQQLVTAVNKNTNTLNKLLSTQHASS